MNSLLQRLHEPRVLKALLSAALALPVLIALAALLLGPRQQDQVQIQRLQIALAHLAVAERANEATRADVLASVMAWRDRDDTALTRSMAAAQDDLAKTIDALESVDEALQKTPVEAVALSARGQARRSARLLYEAFGQQPEVLQKVDIGTHVAAWTNTRSALTSLGTRLEQQWLQATTVSRPLQIPPAALIGALTAIALLAALALRQLMQMQRDTLTRLSGRLDSALEHLNSLPADMERPVSYCLDTTRQALGEFHRCANSTAVSAHRILELGHHARHVAKDGDERLQELSETITRLDENAQRFNRSLGEIEQIAFRTNVLALNAQVEAARAGEQSRSFAILADEVRTLALRSNQVSSQMRSQLAETSARAGAGNQIASGAVLTMRELTDTITVLSTQLDDLGETTASQEEKINGVANAVSGLSEVVSNQARWRSRREEVLALLEQTRTELQAPPRRVREPRIPAAERLRKLRTRKPPRQRKSHLFEYTVKGTDSLDTEPLESVDKFGNQQFGR